MFAVVRWFLFGVGTILVLGLLFGAILAFIALLKAIPTVISAIVFGTLALVMLGYIAEHALGESRSRGDW